MKIKLTFKNGEVRFVAEDKDGWNLADKDIHPLVKSFNSNTLAIVYIGLIANELAAMAYGNSDNEISKIEFVE